jgi:hypothetical protein
MGLYPAAPQPPEQICTCSAHLQVVIPPGGSRAQRPPARDTTGELVVSSVQTSDHKQHDHLQGESKYEMKL